jgi:plastocyanin
MAPETEHRKETFVHTRLTHWVATTLAMGSLFIAAAGGGAAQDATPANAGSAHAHPAHIHLGTCDQLDPNPTFMLTDLTPVVSEPGAAPALPVERGVTTLDVSLDELRAGGYAVNVHQSAEDIGTYIACGSLSDVVDESAEGGALIFGLRELNGSGHSGIAVLTGQGEQTEATVYLAAGLDASAAAPATPAATTSDSEAATEAVVVDIVDLLYVPATIELPVGGAVTWTNSDAVPHTATAQDRALLQSGTLNTGDSFSQTFTAPGTIDYFCEFHANMKGTIIVQ